MCHLLSLLESLLSPEAWSGANVFVVLWRWLPLYLANECGGYRPLASVGAVRGEEGSLGSVSAETARSNR